MISLLLFQREEISLYSLSNPPTYKVCEFNKKKSISTTHNRFSFLMDDKWKLLKCGNMWCTFTFTFLYLSLPDDTNESNNFFLFLLLFVKM